MCKMSARIIYAKPSNKRFIIPLEKKIFFCNRFYCFGKSIKKHPDSLFENNNNNELNVCVYYIKVNY